MDDTFVNIVFPSIPRREFTYRVPPNYALPAFPAQRVIAPLQNGRAIGFITAVIVNPPKTVTIKDLYKILDPDPLIPEELFRFLLRLAHYYLAPVGKTLAAAIPQEYQLQKKRRLVVTDHQPNNLPEPYADLYRQIAARGSILFSSLTTKYQRPFLSKGITELKKLDLITETPIFKTSEKRRNLEKTINLAPGTENRLVEIQPLLKKAPRQWEIINQLLTHHSISNPELARFSAAAIKSLHTKGYISITATDRTLEQFWKNFQLKEKQIRLTAEQNQVFETILKGIHSRKYSTYLIQGVTGSGKTEVYLKLIHTVIADGGRVLVLVPEITLTTHLASRFRGEFHDKIAIWHSGLSRAQRNVLWDKICAGQYPVVIGARSAILLPLPDLRLIIIDEEQDNSFKQQETDPRYHARDAALLRATECQATVVLGSATPSLESLYNAATGKYTKVELTGRYSEAPTATIHVVDMKEEWQKTGEYNIPVSTLLLQKIREKLERGEQTILLQNRRGYSPIVLCPDCGWSPRCRNCDITLTYHKNTSQMLCHYCNLSEPPPHSCPKCQSTRFLYPGYGTQRVESFLREKFPDCEIARMDLDNTRQPGFAPKVMAQFEKGAIQIMLGTQMIAKGLDFPNVTLVGVLNADIGLFMPDFRARERVFQLLYQVAGRAGRGKIQGEIVIQTFNPKDATIRCAIQQNLPKFAALELNERNPLSYPPFSRLAIVLVSDTNLARVVEVAQQVGQYLRPRRKKMEILGPTPAPLGKIRNRYRYLMIIKSRKENDPNGTQLRNLLSGFLYSEISKKISHRAQISIEIDPLDLL
jgi:primosomal protein N' (replication factor Y)